MSAGVGTDRGGPAADGQVGLPAGVSAQELFDASPDGLVVVDDRGTIRAVNARLEQLLGHPARALLGRPVEVLLPPALRGRHQDHRRAYATAPGARGMGLGLELHAFTADGEQVPVDISLGPLPSAGEGWVLAAVRDVSRSREREAGWVHRALHDPLTGLPNRSLLLDRLGSALTRAHRHGRGVGVVFVDLDGFKAVNDALGHAAGDVVLQRTGERLVAATREADTVGRVGGDEFVVILDDMDGHAAAHRYAERLRGAVMAPLEVDGADLSIGCSIGVVVADGDADPAELLASADDAMYVDKAARRAARRVAPR